MRPESITITHTQYTVQMMNNAADHMSLTQKLRGKHYNINTHIHIYIYTKSTLNVASGAFIEIASSAL